MLATQDSAVIIVSWLHTGWMIKKLWSDFWQDQGFPKPPIQWVIKNPWGEGGLNLRIYLHLVMRLRMSRAILPLRNVPSWCT
jgi:hypothetical protein